MDLNICEARSLSLRFMCENPCCVRAVPYENRGEDTQFLTICLYVDSDCKNIQNAAEIMFADYKIEFNHLGRRPLSKIGTRLPSSKKQSGRDLSALSRKIEQNLHVFENRLNVTAVQASYKVVEFEEKHIPCVTVFVVDKGRIPAGETDIKEIKEKCGHLFDHAEFDVTEGYYRPENGPSLASHAFPLLGGVGIGVEGDRVAAGILGGFLEDEEGNYYILFCEHVLHPSGTEDNVIVQPSQRDYETMCENAYAHLQETLQITQIPAIENLELTQEEKDCMNKQFRAHLMEEINKNITKAENSLETIKSQKPRPIGKYICGLNDNVAVVLGGNKVKIYVDAAIAKLDVKESLTMKLYKNKYCHLYGFKKNGEDMNGETVDLESFMSQLHTNDSKLSFMEFGRTTRFTEEGLIDASVEELYLNIISAPQDTPCAPGLSHVPFVYCKDCKQSTKCTWNIAKSEYVKTCDKCGNSMKGSCGNSMKGSDEVSSFWARNFFVIRKSRKPFSEPGDSGPLVFGNDGRAWGLVFGEFAQNDFIFSLASPLSVTLEALEQKSGRKGLKVWRVKNERKGPIKEPAPTESCESRPQTSQTSVEREVAETEIDKDQETQSNSKEDSLNFKESVKTGLSDEDDKDVQELLPMEKPEESPEKLKESYESTPQTSQTLVERDVSETEIDPLPLEKPEEFSKDEKMSNKIAEARSLALQFMSANPCCIRAIPYGNGSDPQSLTICLYVDTDGKGIPKDVKHAAEELFAKFHIEFDDLQQRPLSKIVTPLPSSEKRKDLSCLSRAIEKNLDLFENRLNVTAIQASYKVTDSIEQDIPCVTVFVLGKGRVPAGETNINEIKQPNDYPFDVVEGYYQPADGSSNTSYAFYLRGGVGIGVQGVPGAGTLGGFLEDEEKKCYILSNEHVLHPSEVGNNINEIIIQQPAQLDYDTSLEKARNDLVVSKSKKLKLIGEGPEPTKSEIDLKNDEYFGPIMANYDREITEAEYKLKKIENERPRQIGKYVCGLQSNVPPGDNYPEMFVDAAIAALDEEEFKRMKTDKYAEAETNRCPLYGFKNINGIGLNCNTINIENFVEELPTQNSELSFMKIGRTSGLTNMGRIDPSGKELFVNGISSLYHVKFQYCNDCIGVRGEGEIHQNEYIQSRACARCGNELNNDNEVRSFWLRNCLVIRQKSGEAFCKKGDSGALLFGSDGRAWGLVFGVFKDLSRDMVFCLASPISATLKALEVLSRKKLKLWSTEN